MMLTISQKKRLAQLSSGNPVTRPYGDNFHTFERTMEKLVAMKYATAYVHGGYEITDLGRDRLQKLISEAEEKHATYLASANQARDSGQALDESRYFARAQFWLDEVQILRGRY